MRSFIGNVTPGWLEAQYLLWKESPERVSHEWRLFFQGVEVGLGTTSDREPLAPELALKQSGVHALIHRYRDIGHLLACTDPLSACSTCHPLLEPEVFGLDEGDMERVFRVRNFVKSDATLREIVEVMRETYCRSIGVEFMHIQEHLEREWLIERMETARNRPQLSLEKRLSIQGKLLQTTLFEAFLNRKFPGETRFSLEGGETLIPMLDEIVTSAATHAITDIVLGMSHRGRLSVQATILGRAYENIFAEFGENAGVGFAGDGDVRYHSGFSADLDLADGSSVHLSLAPNPSHLEAIDPVVEGKCRARQDRHGDSGAKKVLPLLIHGDAAFAGQGIVAETLNMSRLEGYGTGGTFHIVLNNQIGFTTAPSEARSTRYATDIAKMLMAPIFHVHGENPEAAVHTVALALSYRQKFGRDVVVELICYRRHGHNEGDEPYFTQPLMCEKIMNRIPVCRIYGDKLLAEGADQGAVAEMAKGISERLEVAYGKVPSGVTTGFKGQWKIFETEYSSGKVETAVEPALLRSMADALAVVPDAFVPHPKIALLLQKRRDAVLHGGGIDWANAETLAFASLLREGVSVRLSGQDSRRGTFSQRHCLIVDMQTELPYLPLASVGEGGALFYPYDSLLSEAGVLGFEYGYSTESPEILTIWEAQYGDFANGAQIIIDQFVSSGGTKWRKGSGLVMLLPHGYEGQGSEHSSARIERFLQLCGDNNMQVAFPTTPAQFFHLLRRQVKQPFRIPLVVFTPKSLLRHPLCVSRLDDFSGDWFQEILPGAENPEIIRAVLICSGKIYLELLEWKKRSAREDVALIRIEQLYPLRLDLLRHELFRYRKAESFAWVQEEPRNMGAWTYIRPYLAKLIGKDPAYKGRKESASPAVGSRRQHKLEQERVIAEAFTRK